MSEEQHDDTTTPSDDGTEAGAAPRGRKPGDLPIPLVVAVITVAVLAFGWIGWKRFQSMREQMLRELAAEEGRVWTEVQENLRSQAAREEADRAAAAAAAGAQPSEGEAETAEPANEP